MWPLLEQFGLVNIFLCVYLNFSSEFRYATINQLLNPCLFLVRAERNININISYNQYILTHNMCGTRKFCQGRYWLLTTFFFKLSTYFIESCTDLPREAIEPKVYASWGKSVPDFLSKPIATCIFQGVEFGSPCPLLWIRPCLKCQKTKKFSCFVVCLKVLETSLTNSVNPISSDLGLHYLHLHLNKTIMLAKIFSRRQAGNIFHIDYLSAKSRQHFQDKKYWQVKIFLAIRYYPPIMVDSFKETEDFYLLARPQHWRHVGLQVPSVFLHLFENILCIFESGWQWSIELWVREVWHWLVGRCRPFFWQFLKIYKYM